MDQRSWILLLFTAFAFPSTALAQPANDDCSFATTILLAVDEVAFAAVDLTGAQDDIHALTCPLGNDVWFQFTAPGSGRLAVSLDSSGNSIAVYRDQSFGMGGCPSDTDQLACSTGASALVEVVAGNNYYVRVGHVAGFTSSNTGTLGLSFGLDDRYTMRVGSAEVTANSSIVVPIHLDSQGGTLGAAGFIQGFELSVCHDSELLTVTEVVNGSTTSTINGGGAPAFEYTQLDAGSFSAGVVIDLTGNNPLPAGLDYELYEATYQVVGSPGSIGTLDVCDTSNTQFVVESNVVVGGVAIPVDRVSGEIAIVDFLFERGDCNNDASRDISDAAFLSDFLFPAPGSPLVAISCFAACDGNDDGALDIADLVSILVSLFGAPSIPLPPPTSGCGSDPTQDTLGCDGYASCP